MGKRSWSGFWCAPLTVGSATFLNSREMLCGWLQVILSHLGDRRLNPPLNPLVFFLSQDGVHMRPHTNHIDFFSSLKLFNFLDELFLSAAGLEWIWRSSSSPWSASKGEAPLRTVSYGRNVVLSRWAGLKLLPCPEVVHEFWAAALLSHIWRVLNRLVTRQTEVSIQWNVFPRSLSQVLS